MAISRFLLLIKKPLSGSGQVLADSLNSCIELSTVDEDQATIGSDSKFLERALGVGMAIILLVRELERARAQRVALQYFVLRVEEIMRVLLGALLRFLLRTRFFNVKLRFDLLISP